MQRNESTYTGNRLQQKCQNKCKTSTFLRTAKAPEYSVPGFYDLETMIRSSPFPQCAPQQACSNERINTSHTYQQTQALSRAR